MTTTSLSTPSAAAPAGTPQLVESPDATALPLAAPTTRVRRRGSGALGPGGWIALVVLIGVVLVALVPTLVTRLDPTAADPLAVLQPPSSEHLAGTDSLGRDVLTRIAHGARYSLTVGIGATALAVVAGAAIGLLAGVGGRVTDTVLARAVDVLASFPEILLALVLIAFTGPGIGNLVVAIGIAGIPRYARIVRAQTQVIATSGYIEQARTFGLSRTRLVLRHVLPNALGPVPVLATIGLGGAIIGAAGLSFLGLGPQAPTPEWGSMLAENRDYLRVAWWGAVFPGVALSATVIASTVLGRQLQARFEGRTR